MEGALVGDRLDWHGRRRALRRSPEETGRTDQPQKRYRLLRLAAAVAPTCSSPGSARRRDDPRRRRHGRTPLAASLDLDDLDDQDRFFRVSLVALAGCAATLFLLGFRIDINEFSLNAFYRNRLVRCFLGAARTAPGERKPQESTGFDDGDDLELARLAGPDGSLSGPLHIINCALNLGGAGDLSLHTRHSASFTLTPFYAGSDYSHTQDGERGSCVGFVPMSDDDNRSRITTGSTTACPTDCTIGNAIGGTTLGRAIAVSGAAASPNMGYHTSPVVAFLLTVFNLRLGWWFPNPGTQAGSTAAPRFNLGYMFAELFASATYRSRFLMISDGGHFENLAVYELIKRRCAVIIASDAECDAKLSFEGLGTLIRMCDVDLGVGIDIDVRSLRPRPDAPWSGQRVAVGTIRYPDRTPGTLIYLKAAMTGHEADVRDAGQGRSPDLPARDDRRPVLLRGSVRELSPARVRGRLQGARPCRRGAAPRSEHRRPRPAGRHDEAGPDAGQGVRADPEHGRDVHRAHPVAGQAVGQNP